MRYAPETGLFYKFVSEEGEERRLYFHMVDEMITLCQVAEIGDSNKALLGDPSWDRKYLYGPDSSDFDPTLCSLFSGYLHVIGPINDSCGSSSLEEDL